MDPVALQALIDAHRRFPAALRALLSLADRELMRQRESEGRWSPLEVLCHLRDEEVEDFRPRAQAAALARPITAAIDPVGWVAARGYNRQEPEAVLADLEVERERSCAWLGELDAAALERAIAHARLGRMRCADFVAAWRMHDLLHLRQIATALTHLEARRLHEYRIDYAGALPALGTGA